MSRCMRAHLISWLTLGSRLVRAETHVSQVPLSNTSWQARWYFFLNWISCRGLSSPSGCRSQGSSRHGSVIFWTVGIPEVCRFKGSKVLLGSTKLPSSRDLAIRSLCMLQELKISWRDHGVALRCLKECSQKHGGRRLETGGFRANALA